MGIGGYLLTLLISSAVAWGGWVVVLYRVNPDESGILGFSLFYLTLGVALFGTLTLLGTFLRVKLQRREAVAAREVKIAFRHAGLLTVAAIVMLILASLERLGWFSFLLVAVLAMGFEALILAFQSGRRV